MTTRERSKPQSTRLDGPFYMIVQYDAIGWCSGCSTTRERDVTYQVMNFSQTPAGSIPIGESLSITGWSCNQQNPGGQTTPCGIASTYPDGSFTDSWSLQSDAYTPIGCGASITDEWQWCATSPPRGIGHLSGYTHTDAISINGVVNPPNQFVQGAVINP